MKRTSKPTDTELSILNILWKHGPLTVREVHELLDDNTTRGYSTVLKLMQIMSEKELVKRDTNQRAHIYRAAITSDQVRHTFLKNLVEKAFDNSTSKLIAQALSTNKVSSKELAKIRLLLEKAEEEAK